MFTLDGTGKGGFIRSIVKVGISYSKPLGKHNLIAFPLESFCFPKTVETFCIKLNLYPR